MTHFVSDQPEPHANKTLSQKKKKDSGYTKPGVVVVHAHSPNIPETEAEPGLV